MKVMPQMDPVPSPRPPLMQHFWRIFRLLAVLSIVLAALAVALVTWGAGEIHASLIIATFLGVGLTVLVGTGLMTLVFLSNSSGHDDAAAARIHQEGED
jgi:hypothetical protein